MAARRWSPRAWFRAWWQARLPLTDRWTLGQRNIYILPTPAGLMFVATLIVMLLAAVNYQLNLGYALTFLLGGAGLVSMHATHNALRGLTLHLKPVAPGFAGEALRLEVIVDNPSPRTRHGLLLRYEDTAAQATAGAAAVAGAAAATAPMAWCDAPAGGQQSLHLALTPMRRGWHAVPTLVLETSFPLGLFRAWTVWRPALRLLAWPAPEVPPPPLPLASPAAGDSRPVQRGQGGEWDGVRPWRRGDTMRQVVWKKVAKSGEMVSREAAGSGARELWLEWAAAQGGDAERRLSRLAAWVVQAQAQGLASGLRLPGVELAPALGDAQRRAQLDALATW
jgi:uncharacterized protein (DUF58 family)